MHCHGVCWGEEILWGMGFVDSHVIWTANFVADFGVDFGVDFGMDL